MVELDSSASFGEDSNVEPVSVSDTSAAVKPSVEIRGDSPRYDSGVSDYERRLNDPFGREANVVRQNQNSHASELIFGKYKNIAEAEKGFKELESYVGKVKNQSEQKVKELESALENYGYQNQAAYNNAKSALFNKYLPLSLNSNVTSVEQLINALPPAAAASLGGELRAITFDANFKDFNRKNMKAQCFKSENPDFISNPVNAEIMDFYFNGASAKPAEIKAFVDRVREDEKKKVLDSLNLQKINEEAKKKLTSEVTNFSQHSFSEENPPSLEQIKKMSTGEYLKYRDIVRKATQNGFYNRK